MHLPRLRSLMSLLASASLLGGAALASTSGAQLGSSAGGGPVVDAAIRPVFVSSCIGYCKHPTNAGKVFRWGLEAWEEEAEHRHLDNRWRSNHPGLVNNQYGMLTITARPQTNEVRTHPVNNKAAYGRWEARVRAVELEKGNKTFRFNWELVPVRKQSRCGARGIVLTSYHPGDDKVARGAVRAHGRSFSFGRKVDLRSRAWHTYAVEVTKRHISWFVDTKVVRTEKRDAALSGVKLRPRFRIVAARHGRMNLSRMQMDWVRYYDLHRPNAKSISAPKMRARTYAKGC